MSKNVNANNFNETSKNLLFSFYQTTLDVMDERSFYSANLRLLRNDKSLNETTLANKVAEEKTRHAVRMDTLNNKLKDTYALIPSETYEAYCKSFNSNTVKPFNDCINEMLKDMGIIKREEKKVSKFANAISIRMGAKLNGKTNFNKTNKLTSTLITATFNKLFMSALCDAVNVHKNDKGEITF